MNVTSDQETISALTKAISETPKVKRRPQDSHQRRLMRLGPFAQISPWKEVFRLSVEPVIFLMPLFLITAAVTQMVGVKIWGWVALADLCGVALVVRFIAAEYRRSEDKQQQSDNELWVIISKVPSLDSVLGLLSQTEDMKCGDLESLPATTGGPVDDFANGCSRKTVWGER